MARTQGSLSPSGLRIAILSDIHGNLPALEAVILDLKRRDIHGLIVAGDFIGGPQPAETICQLQEMDAWMIRGNSDDDLLRYGNGQAPDSWRESRQFALLRWAYNHIDKNFFDFLQSLPEQRVVHIPGTHAIRIIHGSPRDPSESIFPDKEPATLDMAFMLTEEPVLVCGHTHIPWKVERDRRLAINPGAVCGPLNGAVCTQYALLTWQGDRWQVEHREVDYDLEQIRIVFRDSGLLDEGGALARSFLGSIETGQNVAEYFLAHAYSLAAEAGYKNVSVVPDEVWELADQTFDWKSTQRIGLSRKSMHDS